MTHKYKITGMTCNSCVAKVQKTLSEISGVEKVNVTLNPPEAEITMNHHIDTGEMNTVLKKTGVYELTDFNSMKHGIIKTDNSDNAEEISFYKTYKPLIIVFLYIIIGVEILQFSYGGFNMMKAMSDFMGGFFIVFSFFKMLDVKNFAMSYSSYDIIAKKWIGYGYIYPFIELILGILFLMKVYPLFTNTATLIVMGISSIGVIQSVMQKRTIQCACLGTVFNLPMSTVTIVEDLLMVVMSLIMIILMLS